MSSDIAALKAKQDAEMNALKAKLQQSETEKQRAEEQGYLTGKKVYLCAYLCARMCFVVRVRTSADRSERLNGSQNIQQSDGRDVAQVMCAVLKSLVPCRGSRNRCPPLSANLKERVFIFVGDVTWVT